MNKNTVMAFLLGILLTLVVFTVLAVRVRFNALRKAWDNPKVIEGLKIQEKMEVVK